MLGVWRAWGWSDGSKSAAASSSVQAGPRPGGPRYGICFAGLMGPSSTAIAPEELVTNVASSCLCACALLARPGWPGSGDALGASWTRSYGVVCCWFGRNPRWPVRHNMAALAGVAHPPLRAWWLLPLHSPPSAKGNPRTSFLARATTTFLLKDGAFVIRHPWLKKRGGRESSDNDMLDCCRFASSPHQCHPCTLRAVSFFPFLLGMFMFLLPRHCVCVLY
jgi:hypothetical protein